MNMVEVKLDGLALDMTTNTPVVMLSPEGLNKVLPIWIGHAEAWAIAMELSKVEAKRPLTHDLLRTVIESFNAKVEKIEIVSLKEQTFFAIIQVSSNGDVMRIDARPSDSIALALKTGASIFVNEELFDMSVESGEPDKPPMPTDPESLRERLRKIKPEDFGNYSL